MELERTKAELTALGLGLCAISYDTVEIHGAFARRRGITFPLLADPDSAIIRAFGLLDESAAPGSREAGMAHPAILLVDEHGVVRERFVERQYYPRPARLALAWTDEPVRGYRGPVRVTVDVACGTRQEMAALLEGGLGLTIHGTLAFQACDDRTCWPPEVVPLRWQFALTPPDLVRAPEELRHRSKA